MVPLGVAATCHKQIARLVKGQAVKAIQSGGKDASYSVWSEFIDVADSRESLPHNRFCAGALEQIRRITAKHSTPLIK